MNRFAPVAAVLGSASAAIASPLALFEPPPGYGPGRIGGISADGSVFATDMVSPDSWGSDGFVLAGGAWTALPRYGLRNFTSGLSGDGRVGLVVGTNPGVLSRLTHTRDGVRTDIWTATGDMPLSAALTRGGGSALFAAPDPGGGIRLMRWREHGTTEQLARFEDYDTIDRVIAGAHDDRFVFNALSSGAGSGAYLFDAGSIAALPGLGLGAAWATAMTADGSAVIGVETWHDPDSGFRQRSWLHLDGAATAIEATGVSDLAVHDITDDARFVLGVDWDADPRSLLLDLHTGRAVYAEDLLARAGFAAAPGAAHLGRIAADGSVIAGTITGGAGTPFTVEHYFTLSVPTPGVLAWSAALGLFACRRRRATDPTAGAPA